MAEKRGRGGSPGSSGGTPAADLHSCLNHHSWHVLPTRSVCFAVPSAAPTGQPSPVLFMRGGACWQPGAAAAQRPQAADQVGRRTCMQQGRPSELRVHRAHRPTLLVATNLQVPSSGCGKLGGKCCPPEVRAASTTGGSVGSNSDTPADGPPFCYDAGETQRGAKGAALGQQWPHKQQQSSQQRAAASVQRQGGKRGRTQRATRLVLPVSPPPPPRRALHCTTRLRRQLRSGVSSCRLLLPAAAAAAAAAAPTAPAAPALGTPAVAAAAAAAAAPREETPTMHTCIHAYMYMTPCTAECIPMPDSKKCGAEAQACCPGSVSLALRRQALNSWVPP